MTIGSFDIIIGMDWLEPHHADVMRLKEALRLDPPNGDTMIVYGDKSGDNLRIESCIKAQKHLQKKCPAFLAHIVDKSKEVKRSKTYLRFATSLMYFQKTILDCPRSDKSNLELT